MKKAILLLCVLLVAAMVMPASAAKFKDMPDNHWAAKSVYDLVNRGVTQGFPDGTFRGDEKLSRYETAVLLSKMAQSIESKVGTGAAPAPAVDLSAVNADIRALKADVAALRRAKTVAPTATGAGMTVSGSVLLDYKFVNLLGGDQRKVTTRGPIVDYRFKTAVAKNFGAGTTLKIGLDTEDYGNYNDLGAPDFARDLLEAVGTTQLDWSAIGLSSPVALKLSVGPGSRVHTDSVVPADDNVIIDREYNEISAVSSLMGVDLLGAVYAIPVAATGWGTGRLLKGGLGFSFGDLIPGIGGLELDLALDAEKTDTETVVDSHVVADVAGTVGLPTLKLGIGLGYAGVAGDATNKLLVNADLKLDDVWSSGTVVDIAVARVGRNYITSTANLVDAAGRDLFNRQLVSNRLSIGAKVTQKLGAVKLVGIADYTANADGSYNTANNNMTIEGGVGYDIIDSAELTASYRYKKDAVQTAGKDTADMLSVGLLYTF